MSSYVHGRGYKSRFNPVVWGGVAIAFIVIAAMAISFWISRATEHTETFTVKRLSDQSHQTSDGKQGHQYLVFTDKGVYKDTDSLWFFKFNSSDLYGQLEEGHKYTCNSTGFRFSFTSSYRNLIKCHEVN